MTLGTYAGATESYGNNGAQAAPDAVWIFGGRLWVVWEAKSEAVPGGLVSAKHAREVTGHLNFVSTKRSMYPPVGSFAVLATPHQIADHSARALCSDDVYMIELHEPADLINALDRAWEKARSLGGAVDEAGVLDALKAEGCLPSQWIPRFMRNRVNRLDGKAGEASTA